MPNTYSFPRDLNQSNSITFSNHIAGVQPGSSFTFDFGNMQFIYPFGALLTCLSIKAFRQKHRNTELFVITNDSNGTSYAKTMGFFQAAGFPIGDPPGKYEGPTYLPVILTKTSDLRRSSISESDGVTKLSRQLSSRLLQSEFDSLAEQTVAYSFQEIVRNVLEHSRSTLIAYCAQFYPKKNEVEIAIADTGDGIRSTLSRNPNLSHISENEALEYALMPGVSGSVYKGVKQYHSEPTANAGLGLYTLFRLCNEGGEFIISSGQSALRKRSATNYQLFRLIFPGTIVGIRLLLNSTNELEKLKHKYNAEARTLIEQVRTGQLPRHQRVSSLLSENFTNANSEIFVGSRVKHRHKGVGTVLEIFTEHSQAIARVSLDGGGNRKIAISKLILQEN